MPEARFPRTPAPRPSEKSLSGLWSVGFGSAALQERALCAPFRQLVRSSVREFESFQTVSLGDSVNKVYTPSWLALQAYP